MKNNYVYFAWEAIIIPLFPMSFENKIKTKKYLLFFYNNVFFKNTQYL